MGLDWLVGPAREGEIVFLFPERISIQHISQRNLEKKYLETSKKYETFSRERLGYLAQLLY
jgi:hypothetical protein